MDEFFLVVDSISGEVNQMPAENGMPSTDTLELAIRGAKVIRSAGAEGFQQLDPETCLWVAVEDA